LFAADVPAEGGVPAPWISTTFTFWTDAVDMKATELMFEEPFACGAVTVKVIDR
jgi:hypothetical protein